jgi:hypothetical protein
MQAVDFLTHENNEAWWHQGKMHFCAARNTEKWVRLHEIQIFGQENEI